MYKLIVCPACGFSFRLQNNNIENNKIICAICGHKFMDSNILPFNLREFDNNS